MKIIKGKHINQGNIKIKRFITDKLVQSKLRKVLMELPDIIRTPKIFRYLLVNGEPDKVPPVPPLLAGTPNAPAQICDNTARRWMKILGFKCLRLPRGA